MVPAIDRPIMLIDARNILYRAVQAARANYEHAKLRGFTNQPRKHPFPLLVGMISGWIRDFEPAAVQVYWDAPRASVWRRDIFEEYKNRDPMPNAEEVSKGLADTETVAIAMFEWLNMKQFKKDRMEADDLIYAACRVQCTRDLLICSSDADMQQLLYIVPHATIYNPDTKQTITQAPHPHNPVWYKALVGDKSDKIPGYDGIGPKTAAKLLDNPTQMAALLEQRGKETLVRNLKLIDLSMSPYALQNQIFISKALATPIKYDKDKIKELCTTHRVGFHDVVDALASFRRLA